MQQHNDLNVPLQQGTKLAQASVLQGIKTSSAALQSQVA